MKFAILLIRFGEVFLPLGKDQHKEKEEEEEEEEAPVGFFRKK